MRCLVPSPLSASTPLSFPAFVFFKVIVGLLIICFSPLFSSSVTRALSSSLRERDGVLQGCRPPCFSLSLMLSFSLYLVSILFHARRPRSHPFNLGAPQWALRGAQLELLLSLGLAQCVCKRLQSKYNQ